MDAETKNQLAFPVVGRTIDAPAVAVRPLRPALLAPYRDLTTLRYDFPLVLVEGAAPDAAVQSLTAIVNGVLQKVAPRGSSGEKIRRHVLRLEQEIRRRVAAGPAGRLSAVWDAAAVSLAGIAGAELQESLATARAALAVDGELVDCETKTAARVVAHLWRLVATQKRAALATRVEALVVKLSDFLSSGPVSEPRAGRLRAVLKDLVVPPLDASLEVSDVAAAVAACRAQRAALVGLVKAIAIAELEAEDRYDAAVHDAAFAAFSEASLGPAELALAPDVLLCVDAGSAAVRGEVLDILASGLPVKILATTDDLLDEPLTVTGAGTRLAAMAAGVENAFVLQASAASFATVAARIARGLAYAGPALVSVFTGQPAGSRDALPQYLQAAAATQSRLFPTFCYDPSAGPDLVSRWTVADDNPQAATDWSSHPFVYESGGQRVPTTLAVTPADLVACDPRFAERLTLVASAAWTDAMVPVDQAVNEGAGAVAYVPVVDANDRLFRAVVGKPVVAAAARCRDAWRSLQELGGINNSWAERRLAAEKEIWDEEREALVAAAKANG